MFQAAFDWGVPDMPLAQGVKPRGYGLRWYQDDGKAAAEAKLQNKGKTIVVMATGLGKTRLAGAIAGDWPGDVLFLAHRDELCAQAMADMEAITGEQVELEQAELRSSPRARVVVGSVQSFNQKRLDRLGRNRFSLVIVDEVHHYLAKTYRKVLEWFDCPRMGITATPDRGDGKALGKLFDTVAFEFPIVDGIEQGYLVPIIGKTVELKSIDLSGVSKTAGELVAAQLDEAMLSSVGAIVSESMRLYPDRQAIGFMPGVRTAELACELTNRAKPGSAIFICGDTDKDERRQLVKDYKAGKYQYLWNCQVATEGFDAPAASLIILGRPTLSRALHAQMIGRGTRVLPGIVDHLEGKHRAGERRAAVAASGKPDTVVLDFVGNSGKHSLASVVDILGGDFTEAEKKVAKKKTSEGVNVQDALKQAREELRKIAAAAKVKAQSEVKDFNPFQVFHVKHDGLTVSKTPMSNGQFSYLQAIGMTDQDLKNVTNAEAQKLIATATMRRKRGLASYKQLRTLQKWGVTDINISVRTASNVLEYLFASKASRTKPDMAKVQAMIHRPRDAGDDS